MQKTERKNDGTKSAIPVTLTINELNNPIKRHRL